jgi:hypothetical protein
MANIKWCETAGEDDCLTNVEWNNMVVYIKHSAVTDFTIYATEAECVDTGQAFRFTKAGTLSSMFGPANTGDSIKIFANDTDAEPYLLMEGDDYAVLDVASYILFKQQGTQIFKFDYASNVSKMYGGALDGDDTIIYANSNNDCSLLELLGDGNATIKVKAGSIFEVSTCTDETLFEVSSAAGNHHADFHCLESHNFVLENRTDDPGSPCTGQIWFRTDLV